MKLALLGILVFLMLFFGCSGGEQPPQPPANATTATTPENKALQPPPQQNAMETVVGLLDKGKTYRIDYEASGVQSAGKKVYFKMIQYAKNGTYLRTDTLMEAGEIRSFRRPDGMYVCSKEKGREWMCLQAFVEAMMQNDWGWLTLKLKEELRDFGSEYEVTADGTTQLAGTNADCFRITSEERMNVRYCFSKQGAPLYFKTLAGGESGVGSNEFKATSYSTTVSDSNFELPATPS